jgi:molecular chaperone Hsp33
VANTDFIRRFLFEHGPVRGHLVRLDSAWTAIWEHHQYLDIVRETLGEAVAATTLVASTRKFDGTLTLQLQGPGPLHLLVAQCTHGFGVRGVARANAEVPAGSLAQMTGGGRLTVTVETADASARYQGIVPLAGARISECLEAYFRDSEQLPTRLWLAGTPTTAVGLLLQRLPESPRAARRPGVDPDEAWRRVEHLASTVRREELLGLETETLLRRLFHEEDVRLFEPAPVFFRCRCSRDRVAGMLESLGREEIRSIVAEHGEVEVHCEFCNRAYRFDAIDSEQLFRGRAEQTRTNTVQ